MNILIYFYCSHHYVGTKDNNLWGPLIVAIIVFVGNIMLQEFIRNREIKRTVNNTIFKTCETLIRYAYLGNGYIIEAKYCYVLYKKGENAMENKRFYYKYMDEADELRRKYDIKIADLLSQKNDLKIFNKEAFEKIDELLGKRGYLSISEWSGRFNENMTVQDIEVARRKAQDEMPGYIENKSFCKHLRDIQKVAYPNNT